MMFGQSSVQSLESRRLLSSNLVADFNGIFPTDSVTLNGESYFAANDGVHGQELWKSDGTEAGTVMVKDIAVGSGSSNIECFAVVNNRVVFFAQDQNKVVGLYRTDGTAAGTGTIKTFGTEFEDGYWQGTGSVVGGPDHQKFVFVLGKEVLGDHPEDEGGQGFYATDGTAANFVQLGGRDYVTVNDNDMNWQLDHFLHVAGGRVIVSNGTDVVASDGSVAGTVDLGVKALFVGQAGDQVALLDANGATGRYSITDGTLAGTKTIFDLSTVSGNPFAYPPTAAGDVVYMYASTTDDQGRHQTIDGWSYNKLTGMTQKFYHTADDGGPIGAVGGRALVVYNDPQHGPELGITNGTFSGTHLLKDVTPGTEGTWIGDTLAIGDVTYFLTNGSVNGTSTTICLWRTDGTTAGTYRVLKTGYNANDYIFRLSSIGDKVAMRLEDHSEHEIKTLIYDTTADTAAGPAEGTTSLVNGVLRVFGTENDDTIRIYNSRDDDSRFVVNINGTTRNFSYADVTKVIVYGYSGNDDIGVSHEYGGVVLRSSIWGGAGNDTIEGSDGRDTIEGESGDDSIMSGSGNDMVVGGNGRDTLSGGSGSDSLDGGTGGDSVNGGSGNNVLTGGQDTDADTIVGGSGVDVVFGQSVLDIFYGNTLGSSLSDDTLA